MSSQVSNNHPRKRCWTCQGLKIACDKSRPYCQNCIDKGRTCLGYGTKLSWPRTGDIKRSAQPERHFALPVPHLAQPFINTLTTDIASNRNQVLESYDRPTLNRIWFSQQPTDIARLDPFLAAHGCSPHPRLVSSSHRPNDLCRILIDLSLKDDSLASSASRHAISALSYHYLGMEEAAYTNRGRALAALQASIDNYDLSRALQMMAASMLLCIFETLHFNTSPLGWITFFRGTKKIAGLLGEQHEDFVGDKATIVDWLFYHDVMYKFSITHWAEKTTDQIELARQEKFISKPIFSPDRTIIMPLLGCSLGLLDLLCRVIDVVDTRTHKQIRSLRLRLQTLKQRHLDIDGYYDSQEVAHHVRIAEIFRLATLLYLLRLAQNELAADAEYDTTLASAFDMLNHCAFCERPWPLFVIALESRTEEQRASVVRVLEASLRRQPVGQMALANQMIRDAWVQQDLQHLDQLELYQRVISKHHIPPCFT